MLFSIESRAKVLNLSSDIAFLKTVLTLLAVVAGDIFSWEVGVNVQQLGMTQLFW